MSQAAAVLGVSPATVRRASDAGVLPCRRSPGGHRRFLGADLAGLSRNQLLSAGRSAQAIDHEILAAIADLGEAVNEWTDLEELLHTIADHLLAATDAVSCDVYRREDADVFRCLVSQDRDGPDAEAVGAVVRPSVYPVAFEAISDGAVKTVDDRSDRRLSAADLEVYRQYGFESEVQLPLLVQGRVVGLIDLYSDRPRAFAASLDYTRAAAHIIAGAFEKALLLDVLEGSNAALRELLDLAGLLTKINDVDGLLRAVAQRLFAALGADHCDICVRDGDGYRTAVYLSRDGSSAGSEGTDSGKGLFAYCATALEQRLPLFIRDLETLGLSDEELSALLKRGWHSEVFIPLVSGDEVLGYIDLYAAETRDWTKVADLVGGVRQLVAGALEKSELLHRLENGNRELRALADNSLEFGSSLRHGPRPHLDRPEDACHGRRDGLRSTRWRGTC